ncbi:uncharacterized protein [Euwallacea similis]|uniref:uncharacterized protein n=1 Tax=Euwallacea similis TaxID=1736056 RepID=UPI00344CC79B
MASKLLVIVALVTFCVVNFGNAAHSIDQCADPSLATTLICSKDIKESGKFLKVLEEVIDCPESGVINHKITCIKVTNKLGEDGGDAEIVSGGVDYYNVEISLISQRSKGLDYHIEIYTNNKTSLN